MTSLQNWLIVGMYTLVSLLGLIFALAALRQIWLAEKERVAKKLNGHLKLLIRKRAKLYILLAIALLLSTGTGTIFLFLPPPPLEGTTDVIRQKWVTLAFFLVSIVPWAVGGAVVLDWYGDRDADRRLKIKADTAEAEQLARDTTRDEGRDAGRDEIRDAARDAARDLEKDNGHTPN